MKEEQKINNCAFCKKPPTIQYGQIGVIIKCNNCGAKTQLLPYEKAFQIWNKPLDVKIEEE